VLDTSGRVLLVHFDFGDQELPNGLWACPGGGIERHESPADGLRRELREEVGLDVVDVGQPIWRKEHVFPMSSGWDGRATPSTWLRWTPSNRARHSQRPTYLLRAWTTCAGGRWPSCTSPRLCTIPHRWTQLR
jgi:8-oxo-dGTP pyrophosphatase MutT (NUDIX family)